MPETGKEAAVERRHADPIAKARAAFLLEPKVSGTELSRTIEDRVFDPDPDVRILATSLLATIPGSGSPEILFSALQDPNPEVVLAAAEALVGLGPPRTADALTECLASRPELAGPFALAMATLGDPGVEDLLLDLLAHDDAAVRIAVLRGLGACGTERSVTELLGLLGGSEDASCAEALSALTGIRDRVPNAVERAQWPEIPADRLAELVRAEDRGAILTGISLIAWLRPEDGPALLLGLLESPDPNVRERATEVFGAIAAGDSDAALAAIVESANSSPEAAASALDRVAKAREGTSGAVFLLLAQHPDPRVRERAAALAGRSGGEGVPERLVVLLQDSVGHVRARAAEALGLLRWAAGASALEELLGDPFPDVREAALGALRALRGHDIDPARLFRRAVTPGARAAALRACDPRRAGDAFVLAVSDADPEVRLAAAASLMERGLWREEATALLADEEPRVRAHALRARLVSGPTLEPLSIFLHDPDPGVRQALALGLEHASGVERVAWLRQLLKDPCGAVGRAAARALANHPDPQTLSALLDAVSTGSVPVSAAAIDSLGALSDPEALPRLRAVARGGSPELRDRAVRAARRIEEART